MAMPFSTRISAIFGPMPFTYCTLVERSSKEHGKSAKAAMLLALAFGQSALREVWPKAKSRNAKNCKSHDGVAFHSYMLRRLLKQFAAILIGNVFYFLLCPHLPPQRSTIPIASISACWSISGFAWWSTASSS